MKKDTSRRPSLHLIKDRQEEIRELVVHQLRAAALNFMVTLFRDEVDQLCGPAFKHKKGHYALRGGSEKGSVIIQGQRMAVTRPRVRRGKDEVPLESYSAMQGFDILSETIMSHMLSGVSTRNYEPLLDEIQGGLGLSKSSVSKAFKIGSAQALNEINGRSLATQRWVSLMIDGIGFGKKTVVAAVGITLEGKKIILGLREGSTENAEICKDLLESLVDRGLDANAEMLFIIDGGKALRKGISKVFGETSTVQRCILHKARNIEGYLPKACHPEFKRRWGRLHGLTKMADAEREYSLLAAWLGEFSQQARASLEEAEKETLTVIRLEVPALLRKTIESTNVIESSFSMVREASNRVKNWNAGPDQASRWAASTLLEAEKRFKRVRGHAYLPALVAQIGKIRLAKKSKVA